MSGAENVTDCYQVTCQKRPLTIKPAEAEYTEPTEMTGLVYNGKKQQLLVAGQSAHGEFQYQLENGTWSKEVPEGTKQ